jgi:hypothetical protein
VGELKAHDGSDCSKPLLLCVLGEVYDVGTGRQHYQPSGGYSGAAGRDSSRSYSSGDYSDAAAASRIDDLSSDQVESVLQWREFYRTHETYRYVGVLAERYYDDAGTPTAALGTVEKLQEATNLIQNARDAFNKRFKSCNSRSGADIKTELWCDDSWHLPGSTPLHVWWQLPSAGSSGEKGGKCACVPQDQREALEQEAKELAERPSPGVMSFRLVDYPECKKGKQKCKRPKNAAPPE